MQDNMENEIAQEINYTYASIADGTPGFVEQETGVLLDRLDDVSIEDDALQFQKTALGQALMTLKAMPLGHYKSEWADTIKYMLAQMSVYWDKKAVSSAQKAYRHAVGSIVVDKKSGKQGKIIGASRSRAHNGRSLYTVRFFDDSDGVDAKTFYANELQRS